MLINNKWQSVTRYGWSGFIGTAVHYTVLYVLLKWSDLGPVAASTIGAVCGAMVNYLLAYYFVFESKSRHISSFSRFAVVTTGGWFINAGVLASSVPVLNIVTAQLSATATVFIWGYTLNRYWSFSKYESSTSYK
ncbi:MAG: hypothetical protein BMS9Abin33_0645 [Gammaproteobacteria bacterium]|nr:MAG: hypothetical protein BMS9Abin33_0645 [Gammaproteobacteria bacterium]